MSNIAPLSLLTYFPETTQGTPPANAAAWIASGVRLRHIAETLDVSGVERTLLTDERNQSRVFASELRIESIDNPEFPFAVYAHGTGATTAAGAQIATTAPGYQLGLLLGHALGGITRGYSNECLVGSTTTVLNVTDASDHTVGEFVAVEYATAFSPYPDGTAWPRRIIELDTGSTPNTITLDQALPQAPAAADPIHGCLVMYPDEDVIADSSAASGRTRSYLVQKGLPAAGAGVREAWEFRGCVETLQNFQWERGADMRFAFQVMAGSHGSPETAPWPTAWAANAELGLATLAFTPLTELWMVTEGVSTNTLVQISRFEVEPGVPRVRNETVTTGAANMHGTYGYSTAPAETLVTLAVTPFGLAQWTDQRASTYKTARLARLGPAGSGIAVHFERLSHVVTPKREAKGTNTDVMVQFKAHEVSELGTTTELQQAKFCIVMW
jgi:hypothetical protein